MKRHPLYHLSADEIVHYAGQYIHNRRNRGIFIDRYCEGLTFEELAGLHHLEPEHIQRLMHECMTDVLNGIDHERGA